MTMLKEVRLEFGAHAMVFRVDINESVTQTLHFKKPQFGEDYAFVVAEILLDRGNGPPHLIFDKHEVSNLDLLLSDLIEHAWHPRKLNLSGFEARLGGVGTLYEKLFEKYVDEQTSDLDNNTIDEIAKSFVASSDSAHICVYELNGTKIVELTCRDDRCATGLFSLYFSIENVQDFVQSVEDVRRSIMDSILLAQKKDNIVE